MERCLMWFQGKGSVMASIRVLPLGLLFLTTGTAFAEGRCPPGQYPVGDQNVGGCAPIPSSGPAVPASRPTGKWETRWGAIARDASPTPGARLAIGVAESQRTKKAASAVALAQCVEGGGNDCRVLLAYNNQCAALSGPAVNDWATKGEIACAVGAPGTEGTNAKSGNSLIQKWARARYRNRLGTA